MVQETKLINALRISLDMATQEKNLLFATQPV